MLMRKKTDKKALLLLSGYVELFTSFDRQVLHKRYQFMDHLMGMRRYLLLGQGDFIRHLMDLLAEDLEKPANLLYMHNLTGGFVLSDYR